MHVIHGHSAASIRLVGRQQRLTPQDSTMTDLNILFHRYTKPPLSSLLPGRL